jgi:anti-sigma regulatory factor (Ser/Thr protein kinase)
MYAGGAQFARGVVPFIRVGVARREPTLVVVGTEKIDRLRRELGDDADQVQFTEMNQVGANPAWIIPAWQEFLEAHPRRRLRGIGEPIDAQRDAAELIECQHHERLLNLAFEYSQLFLVCPYDTEALDSAVIAEARHSHPLVTDGIGERLSGGYVGRENACALLEEPLPEPSVGPRSCTFNLAGLRRTREFVAREAQRAGLSPERSDDLVLAVHEVATNSVRHGGGEGTLRIWIEPIEPIELICEIRDRGRVDDPLAGRRRPTGDQASGYGLWLANRVCDLVQLRTGTAGSTVRVHMRLG